VLGLQHTSVASATFSMSLSPVFFALAQRWRERRALPAYVPVSLGLASGGAAWLLLQGGMGRLGDLLVLAASLLYVGYLLAVRRVAGDLPHLALAQTIYFWGGLAGLPVAWLAGGLAGVQLRDTASLAALAGLVLFPTLLGHTAANFGVRHLKPLTVSFFTLAEPLVATAAALLLLGEPPRLRELPALALFLSATLLYLLASARRREV
jgi:drug/metabolite transporter (DMT)-like permease